MFRADIGVEAVGQRIADRLHMPARAARRFEHGDIVAALHEFISAAQAADAAARDDDALRGGLGRGHAGGGGEQRETGRFQGLAPRVSGDVHVLGSEISAGVATGW